ncbi:MAG TPA: GreA/GreB family elongation factor [Verrucomicrobiae bacterium]|nr:GreA/GreB family elongation factor [Verrucomicrobiae bacterium]
MSKAFTRESDDDNEGALPRPRAPLPQGVKNYITAEGAQRLREELAALLERAHSSEKPERKPLRDARMRQLQEIIGSLVVAEVPHERDVIRFDARVTVRRESTIETYRLVGIDEADLDRNEISWLSPLAKVLLGKHAGDRIVFRSPSGMEEITVLSVDY